MQKDHQVAEHLKQSFPSLLPVTLDIFAAEKDFTGVMKVTLPGENGKGIAYQSAVKCKAGEKEKIVLKMLRSDSSHQKKRHLLTIP